MIPCSRNFLQRGHLPDNCLRLLDHKAQQISLILDKRSPQKSGPQIASEETAYISFAIGMYE
jgi:hypothetical protein